jgi:hypothetical protein
MAMEIHVKKVGEESGLCRELFVTTQAPKKYHFVRQEDYPGQWNWYTADRNWEPSMPVSPLKTMVIE